jgi:hypothetical protein
VGHVKNELVAYFKEENLMTQGGSIQKADPLAALKEDAALATLL